MKKYRLLRETPLTKANTIFQFDETSGDYFSVSTKERLRPETIQNFPGWFEELNDAVKHPIEYITPCTYYIHMSISGCLIPKWRAFQRFYKH